MKSKTIRDAVQESMNANRGKWRRISRETGIPYFTITNFMQGRTPNPGLDTIQPLLDYFHYELRL